MKIRPDFCWFTIHTIIHDPTNPRILIHEMFILGKSINKVMVPKIVGD